ncbi:MAG: GNAT family N-acetyltransferase [Clostridia bacterium]|nr:GNAT family N-acetyltransferase [Clostridiales bacterium]MBQ3232477.1 GNAT family N-acetyltransferase [Clostridia bacterium]MBQ4619147.1 GNAT family N-acetyltransferase [Clostridia bacterium]
MELTTERCLVRNMMMKDADDVYQVLSDERVMTHIEPAFDIERTKNFIQSAGLCEPPLVYSIVWKMTGKVIGHAIFHLFEKNDYEIGWVLHQNYWGMGIANEVTKELIKYARYLGVESCIIECDERQIASQKVAIKNGFAYEDESDNLKRYRLVL